MPLEPRIEAVRAQYGLATTDFWQIPQNKQWVCKHAALEVVAVKARVEWLPPQIIEANAPELVTSMVVTGRMGDRVEWATGETNATNYSVKGKQPAYPWAMTEKRAKDRVVLKLVGIHGLVYSEDEMPSGEPAPSQEPPRRENGQPETGWREDGTRTSFALKNEQPDLMKDLDRELDECQTLVSFEKLKAAYRTKAGTEKWNKSFMNAMKEMFDRRETAIMAEMERLEHAEPEELSKLPARTALEHSVNVLAGG
jgi:hypothetical protein